MSDAPVQTRQDAAAVPQGFLRPTGEIEVRALVARHRRVRRILSLPRHHYGAVASPSKRVANREYLVLGTLR